MSRTVGLKPQQDWCSPGWRGGELSEQVRMFGPPEGVYTVIVEGLAGPEQLQAAAQVNFNCGEPAERTAFGPFVLGAAPFTSGLWTAFTFNPATCQTEAVNLSSAFERYEPTCRRCDRRRGDQSVGKLRL